MSTLNEPSSVNSSTNPIPMGTAPAGRRILSNAVEILDYMMRDDPEMQRMVERATVEAMLGQAVYDAREKLEMTREQLAAQVGVTAEIIEDIEEGDYEDDILALFGRIASVLKSRIVVSLESN